MVDYVSYTVSSRTLNIHVYIIIFCYILRWEYYFMIR